MSNIAEEFEHANCTVEIHYDDDPLNPRTEYDNLGIMVCGHSRYTLGDEHGKILCAADIRASKKYRHGWEDYHLATVRDLDNVPDLERTAKDCGFIVLPLYLYDHSGLIMNTTGFSCPWDSGQVGFIYITPERARAEFGVKRITADVRERIIKSLTAEVETYDQYLRGECYGYTVEHKGDESDDSCWGFLGDMSYVIEQAKESAESLDVAYRARRQDAVKGMVRHHIPLNVRQKKLATLYPV